MNKSWLTMLLLASSFVCLMAQDDDPDEFDQAESFAPLPEEWKTHLGDSCYAPEIRNFSMIHYQNYSKAYMEIKGLAAPIHSVGFKELGTRSDYQTCSLQPEGGLLLRNLLSGRLYSIQTVNSCGQPLNMAFEVTRETEQDMVSVPAPLFEAIADYVAMDSPQPLPNFLASLTHISPYVKTAFIQQYFFRGRPFDTDFGDLVPSIPPINNLDSCFCNMLVTDEYATPAITSLDKTISDKGQPNSGTKRNIAGENNADYWFFLNNQGAAKWHQLYTTGYKTTKGKDLGHNMTWQTGDTSSLNYITRCQQGRIRMNLLCMDGKIIPKECACEKDVKLGYGYDTRLHAEANVRSSLSGSKNAVAQVEDMAIVSFFEALDVEDTYIPIDFRLGRGKAACGRAIEQSFWTRATDISKAQLDIGLALFGFKNAKTIDTLQLQNLGKAVVKQANNYKGLLDAPQDDPSNCGGADVVRSAEGGLEVKIRPNKACSFQINTFDKLFCSGRRNWFSSAYVVSDFYLNVIISANSLNSAPAHCCSPGVASWVLGACAGSPISKASIKNTVVDNLRVWGFNDLMKMEKQDLGFTTRPVTVNTKCNKLPINPFGGGGEDRRFDMSGISALSIWDATGKMIADFNIQDTQSVNLDALVQEKLLDMSAGVYFIRTAVNGQISTRKVFIR